MIPQNTTEITNEMRRQLEIDHEQFQENLVNYFGWINQSQILLEVMLYKIDMKWKNYKKRSNFNKIMISIFFKKWSI